MRMVALVLAVVALCACATDDEYIAKRCNGISDLSMRQICGVMVLEQRRQMLLDHRIVTCMPVGGGMTSCH